MSIVTGTGTTTSLPNYAGMLFTSDPVATPIFSAIGGLTGGIQTENFEFPIGSQYELPAPKQPAISERDSLTAPEPQNVVRTQLTNVTQIFYEAVSISYVKDSNRGRMSGLNTVGQKNNALNELDFQLERTLEKMARDIEYTIINGVYQKSNNDAMPNKTRGMLELCKGGNTITGVTTPVLTKEMMNQLFKEMYDNGAIFKNLVIYTNSAQKQIITSLYTIAPQSRQVGGSNIQQIETDFGNIGIQLNRFMPQDTLLAAELSVMAPVFQPVPDKGNFFYEPLAKKGASEDGQVFGQFGLDHGPAFMHGSITGLKA